MRELAASVIVPTRNRPEALAACLDALRRQTASSFEILVVDDASTDAAAVASVVSLVPNARVVRGSGRGPAAARNAGAALAAAPILCFTDDDCRPVAEWVEACVAQIEEGAAAVAGPTHNGLPANPYATAAQAITNHLVTMSLDASGTRVGFAPTSNLACRVELHREQPFDEDYPLAAGEDREWCERLRGRGIEIAYEPAASVTHCPALSFRAFLRQQERYGRGAYRYHRDQTRGPRFGSARFYLELVRAGFAHGARVGALVLLAQVATAVGLLREVGAARRAAF
jgi:glycosyltransferase involved in cell wall biosynthesis